VYLQTPLEKKKEKHTFKKKGLNLRGGGGHRSGDKLMVERG